MPYIVWMAFNQFRMGYATAIGWLVFIIAVAITIVQLTALQHRRTGLGGMHHGYRRIADH